ncbi:MAG: GNAT family N-acetyltransferase [Bacteroidetes bacterium]|nr:MAG: GNAT family N-acetyltransferase [Bacteroidota bacterium]
MPIEDIHLEALDRYNWELCLDLRLSPEQEAFVPSVLYSLAQSRFEQLTPYGIRAGGHMVGFIMYGTFGQICWINRVLVDHAHQGKGIGQSAVRQLIALLQRQHSCREIRTSHAAENAAAAAFFGGLGFVPVAEPLEDEVVLRWEGM